jgi:NADH-quinone oxidoreductase subunit N
MSIEIPNMIVALPEMVILVMASIALLGDLFCARRFPNISYFVASLGLVITAALCFWQIGSYRIVAYHGLFVTDDIANIMKVFICITVLAAFIYSKHYISERKIPQSEYYILGLFSTLGMMILVSAHSLLTVYLGLELMSLPIYAMTAIRREEGTSSEAAMKYFVMGAIASGMLLYGMSMLYGATGQLDITMISTKLSTLWPKQSLMIGFAMVFIVCGIGFKVAAVPFHMWAPDVYDGAPSSVTLFISSAPKIAAVGMAMRLLIFAMPDVISQWQQLLIIMALFSTAIGNLLAISQSNIKRMLAYSGISHIGYTLFGIIAGNAQGYSAALFYIVIYALMSAAAFGLVVLLSRAGVEAENIDDLKGMNQRNPLLAFLMLVVMFSMAGVPPTVGFFTKLLVLKALVDVQLTWLAVAGLLFAVVGAFYYIRIVKVMYFDAPVDQTKISLNNSLSITFGVNSLALLYFGLFPGALIQACVNAFS